MAPPRSVVAGVVRWGLCLFAFSLPFEYPGRSFPVEITTLTAAVFLLTTVRQPKVCYGRISWAGLWFFGFLLSYGAVFVFGDAAYSYQVMRLGAVLVELVLVFWAASNVMRDERVARSVWWVFVAACCIRAALQFAGIDTAERAANRHSALGQNANLSAVTLGTGLLALVGLTYARSHASRVARIVALPLLVALCLAIVQTGSRGGLLALAVGLLVLALGGRTPSARVRNAVVAACSIALLGWVSLHSPDMAARLLQAEEGNLAGREAIFPTGWQMFVERPLLGWGPAANKYELGARLPWQGRPRRDMHNLVLELLTGTGLAGTIPFGIALSLCIRAAWRARRGTEGILPLSLVSAVLVANMSGNFLAAEGFWLVLAYAASSDRSRRDVPAPARASPLRPLPLPPVVPTWRWGATTTPPRRDPWRG